jgi:tetratricopeptide (TPR) repeat protein
LEASPIEPAKHILLLRMLGTTHIRNLEYPAAYRACRRALDIADRHGLDELIAVCYTAIATCAGYLGWLDECLELCERTLEIVPEENLAQRERAFLGIGAVHWGRGDMTRAEAAYREAAEVSARLRGGEPDTLILANIARVCLDSGRLDEAMGILGEVMRACRRLHDEFGLAIGLTLISRYHWLKKDATAAVATGREALLKYREADFAHYSMVGLFQQALILAELREWESATILLAATQGIGRHARQPDEVDYQRAILAIKEQFEGAAFERAWAKGLAMGVEEAFRVALRH